MKNIVISLKILLSSDWNPGGSGLNLYYTSKG